MHNRVVTGLLGLGVALAVRGTASVGQDLHVSKDALVASWSEFETAFETRIQRLAEQWRTERPRPNGAVLKVIQSDLIRSQSITHPVKGLVEIEAEFCEGESVRLPNGARTLCRIVSFELYFSPRDKRWEFAHGTATLVWSADEKNEHPGTRVRVDLDSPSTRWGMDLIEQLLVAENSQANAAKQSERVHDDKRDILSASYFPMDVGYQWMYDFGEKTVIFEVMRSEETERGEVFLVRRWIHGEQVDFKLFVESDGVYVHQEGDKQFSPPLRQFTFPGHPGATWKWRGKVNDKPSTEEFTILGVERITVPAGTYSTIAIQQRSADNLDHTTFWLAEGIGVVKLSGKTESKPGDESSRVLFEWELRGFDVHSPYSAALIDAIHLFAAAGQGDHIQAILEKHPRLASARRVFDHVPRKPLRTDDFTPLHHAAENGHEAVVAILLDRGADVNRGGGCGWTALHLAAQRGHLSVVKLLVKQGAKVNAKTVALPEAVSVSPGAPDDAKPNKMKAIPALTPLELAKKGEHADVVEFLESKDK